MQRIVFLMLAAGLLCSLSGCSDAKQRQESANHMKGLLLGIQTFQSENQKWPDSLADIKPVVGAEYFPAYMKNPLTGDDPGYEYVKPPEVPDSLANTIALYQLRGGKRDETLKVGYLDGTVRDKGT